MAELRLTLEQRLQQRLSPQQIQTVKLLELPVLQLEQRIKQEIEENPLLEEVEDHERQQEKVSVEECALHEDNATPYYKSVVNNRSKDDPDRKLVLPAVGMSLPEHLLEQLSFREMTATMTDITRYLVGNIDDDGYLRNSDQALADDMTFVYGVEVSVTQIRAGINIIQSLDPPGVGSRDLRECLILQIDRQCRNSYSAVMARRILTSYFDDFSKRRFDRLMSLLHIDEEQLRLVIDEIRHLSPKPGSLYAGSTEENSQYVLPDFTVEYADGEFTVKLNQRGVPELKISSEYAKTVARLSASAGMGQQENSEAERFVRSKMDNAKWFINALKQRQETLMRTITAIVDYQRDYFSDGDEASLRPMILRDVADLTGLDVSTVSRVVNSKYVQTNFGIFSLKELFSESMRTDEGEEVSAREVRKILRERIDAEDKRTPLTDEVLMQILNEAGYNIARRTVAKYRDGLGIPVARLRREI